MSGPVRVGSKREFTEIGVRELGPREPENDEGE